MFSNFVLLIVSIFGLVHFILVHDLSQAQLIGFGTATLILGLMIGLALLALRYLERVTVVVLWGASRLARLRRKSFDPSLVQVASINYFIVWDRLRSSAWWRPALGAVVNVAFDMLTL
jgi:hypothetical protein